MSRELSDQELQAYIDEIIDNSSTNTLAEDIAREHLREQDELRAVDLELAPVEKIEPNKKISSVERYEKRRREEREAIHEALNQTYLDLNSVIDTENKKTLIALIVKGYTDNVNKYKNYIEHTFDKSFRKFIPTEILKIWQKYPETMVPFPGFTYKCSNEYGQGKSYFVALDLPMYFRPEICQEMFKKHCESKVMRVEKSIALYYYHKQVRAEAEVRYAKTLAGIITYYQLLRKKPFWYSLLIKHLKQKNNWT